MESWIARWLENPLVSRALWTGLGLLFVYLVVSAINRRFTPRIADVDARYRTRKFVGLVGWVAAALVVIGAFSGRLGGLTVAFGVAGAGIAFALQEVIASIAGWVAIMAGNFFAVGDRVRLGGIRGDVIDIGVLRTTVMECGDWVAGDLYNGRIVRIANSFVFKEPVFNYSGDFPFLWDEITLPVAYGSDRARARRILEEALAAEVGEYARTATASWQAMVRKYRIEDAQIEPMITLVANDNWMEYTARYVVDFKRRRGTKDRIFERVLDAVDASGGTVRLASATFELVGAPDLKVQVRGET